MCVCVCVCVLVAQSYLTLCNPMDYSPPGSSVYGILQARILEWVAMPFSKVRSVVCQMMNSTMENTITEGREPGMGVSAILESERF